jgi:hypothetical protein
MTAKASKSGFDADKFRKLVAMFDSDFTEEASTAFRLALGELKKNQLRFCDRLVDSSAAKRQAEIECAKVRDELNRILDLCARRQADVDDAHEIIDRLYTRINAMEKKAGTKARRYKPANTSENLETAAPSSYEIDEITPNDWNNAPPPPVTPTPEKAQGSADRLRTLAFWKAAYWSGLLSLVLMYAALSYLCVQVRGHLLTLADWRGQNLLEDFFLLVFVTAFFFVCWKFYGPPQTRIGLWCTGIAGSARVMLAAPFVLMALNCAAYFFFHQLPGEVELVQMGIVSLVGVTFQLRYLLRTFGWMGIGIKAALVLDAVIISLTIMNGDIPWWTDFPRHLPITPERGLVAIYFLIGWAVVFTFDAPTRWAIEHEPIRNFVLAPALFSLLYGSAMLVDYKIEGHKTPPSVIERGRSLHAKPKRGALVPAPRYSPVLLDVAMVTPQPYSYMPDSDPKSNADVVRGWYRDLKAFFDDLIGEEAEEGIIALIALRWLWKASQKAKDRRIRRKAIERALNPPPPPNIYGDAGFADRGRAKKGGWL